MNNIIKNDDTIIRNLTIQKATLSRENNMLKNEIIKYKQRTGFLQKILKEYSDKIYCLEQEIKHNTSNDNKKLDDIIQE